MALEEHYVPEKEHLFEQVQNIANQLKGNEFLRAIYIFQDEMKKQNQEDDQEKHIKELLKMTGSFGEFYSAAKTSYMESVRSLSHEYLSEKWFERERIIKNAF